MQRCSSAAIKVDFNLKEAKVGHSSIDKLPIRRIQSSKSLSKVSQKSKVNASALQNQQYQIDLLKRINQSLERQNTYLKKQMEFFQSRRTSINDIASDVNKIEQRKKILSRLSVNPDKNQTESTGLFNSKVSSARRHAEDSINQLYERYTLKQSIPKPDKLNQVLNNYILEIQQAYLKIKQLSTKIPKTNKMCPQTKQIEERLKKLQCAVTEGHKKNPLKKDQKNKQIATQNFLQNFTCSGDLTYLLEQILRRVSKCPRVLHKIKNSLHFAYFIKKINRIEKTN